MSDHFHQNDNTNLLKLSCLHSHKKRKDSLETRVVLLIFSLVNFLWWPYREYIKTGKNGCFHCFNEEFFSENDFEAVLATFYCYDYGTNASEAVEKIATNQKIYNKCSLYVIVCCITKAYHQYPQKRLVTGTPPVYQKNCRSCREKGAITSSWWVLLT